MQDCHVVVISVNKLFHRSASFLNIYSSLMVMVYSMTCNTKLHSNWKKVFCQALFKISLLLFTGQECAELRIP